jgi:hypothetical protein
MNVKTATKKLRVVEGAARARLQASGAVLPDDDSLARLVALLAGTGPQGHDRGRRACEAYDAGDGDAFCGGLLPSGVTPGAETLLSAFAPLLGALARRQVGAYKAALRELRPVLASVLQARPAWRDRSPDVHFGPDVLDGKARGFGLVTVAAQCIRFAADELTEWVDWHHGGALRWHRFYSQDRLAMTCHRRGHGGMWAKDVHRHTLPPEEAAVLITQGLVTQAEIDAVAALPEIPDEDATQGERIAAEIDRLPEAVR